MSRVFICYRRGGAAGEAKLLCKDLVELLGRDSVFMDVDSISPGRDFRIVLQRTLAACDVMLVVIGKHWADVNEGGRTRLEDPHDFVRMEIEAALKRDIPIAPVLTQGARMPTAEQLPKQIRDLAYRHAFELSHNRWDSDVSELIRRLDLQPTTQWIGPADRGVGKAPTHLWAMAKKWVSWLAAAVFILIMLEYCAYEYDDYYY